MATDTGDANFDQTYLYHQIDEYKWDEDEEFQGGLRAILGSVQDPAQVDHLTLRAKCYYYARKAGVQVDFNGYKRWVESGGSEAQGSGTNHTNPVQSDNGEHEQSDGLDGMVGAPRPASFAEICDMIAEGKPIPGIKDIPDTVLEGQASESQAQKRRKPWEKNADRRGGEKLSWMADA